MFEPLVCARDSYEEHYQHWISTRKYTTTFLQSFWLTLPYSCDTFADLVCDISAQRLRRAHTLISIVFNTA